MNKIAFLIGNDNYDNPKQQLDCAVNDVNDLSVALDSLGFVTETYTDIDRFELAARLSDLSRKLKLYDVCVFFYAGHGFQVKGENYIACTDTQFEDDISISHTGYKLQEIINDIDSSDVKIKIMIIDACRTYMSGSRGESSSFAPIMAPKGTLIALATSPGQSAKEDKKSGHGYYTKALLKHIKTQNITIEDMFKRVRNTVYMETKGTQIPWEHTSLLGDFSFNYNSEIRSGIRYSKHALADRDYEPVKHGICYQIIQKALTHDYNYQNDIPDMLSRGLQEIKDEEPDDIFVLGRNIYQSSAMAFDVQHYFEDLHTKLSKYPKEFSMHLLNGMAYEIFFDSDGKLRSEFKTHESYKKIIEELYEPTYDECKRFIYSKVSGYSQAVVYIPGKKLDFSIYLQPYSDDFWFYEGDYYRIAEIHLDGINVMYNRKGTDYYSLEEDYTFSEREIHIPDCEQKLIEKVVGRKRGVNCTFYHDTTVIEEDIKIIWSDNFRLIKYLD